MFLKDNVFEWLSKVEKLIVIIQKLKSNQIWFYVNE